MCSVLHADQRAFLPVKITDWRVPAWEFPAGAFAANRAAIWGTPMLKTNHTTHVCKAH
jgi:hypothetical protein